MPPNKPTVLGVGIDCLGWAELVAYCRQALLEDTPKHIVTAHGEILLLASQQPHYAEILNSADLVIPDSTNLSWVLALKGKAATPVIPGVDLAEKVVQLANESKTSVYLLGAKEGIAQKAADYLQKKYPGLKIAGTSNANPEDEYSIKAIRESGAGVLLVAYGAPKQEEWIARHKNELGAKILIGIGGTLDMWAGVLPRAPKIMRLLHLEWLWRLVLQPSRIGRIWRSLVVFPLKAIFSK